MIRSTTATLEWAAQVSAAAITTHSTGSCVIGAKKDAHGWRLLGRRQRIDQNVQRQQRQPKADGDTTETRV